MKDNPNYFYAVVSLLIIVLGILGAMLIAGAYLGPCKAEAYSKSNHTIITCRRGADLTITSEHYVCTCRPE